MTNIFLTSALLFKSTENVMAKVVSDIKMLCEMLENIEPLPAEWYFTVIPKNSGINIKYNIYIEFKDHEKSSLVKQYILRVRRKFEQLINE